MNNKTRKLFTFLSAVVFLTSCNRSYEELPDKYILMPSGAPTLAAYKLINDDKVNILTDASSIPAAFSLGKSPFIVFDSLKALNILKKQGENAKYKYVKMLTGGNFHLLAFNKTQEEVENLSISDKDVVYGFQKGNTPDLLFKKLFKDAGECDVYFNSISDLNAKLSTMNKEYKIDNTVVNYAIVAEPACTVIKAKLTSKNLVVQDIDLQKEFKNKVTGWDKDYIPQAGLFIRNDVSERSLLYKTVIEQISLSIDNVLRDSKAVQQEILDKFEDQNQVGQSHYGFLPTIITKVQGDDGSKNGFGIVPNDVVFEESDINNFGSLLAK